MNCCLGLVPALAPADLLKLQNVVSHVQVSDALVEYILAIVRHTRENPLYREGLSPRAGLALRRAAQAWALMEGRNSVLPEDVQAILPAVVTHRLLPEDEAEHTDSGRLAQQLLESVPIP